MRERIALLVQASRSIGTGHFLETVALAHACLDSGMEPLTIITEDTPKPLRSRIAGEYWIHSSYAADALPSLCRKLASHRVRLAITNFRDVTNHQVLSLTQAGLFVVCVDERGRKQLDCHAVVNPSLVRTRHEYASDHPQFRLYAGPQYLALSTDYAQRHMQPRQFRNGISSIVISMGGVDRTGATLQIVEALLTLGFEAETHVVTGAGFAWATSLERVVSRSELPNWRIHRDVPSLASLFASADVAITAGGNTLYELACLGTPAIVLHEDPHEKEQGLAFQAESFGLCLEAGRTIGPQQLAEGLGCLSDPTVRRAHSEAGRRLVDGRGAWRISQLAAELLSQ